MFVYVLPAVSNFVLGGMFFITATRFSQAGVNSFIVGGALAAWALVYSFVSFFISKVVKESNAAKLVEIAGILFFLGALGFMIFDGLYTQFVWIFVTSIASGIYCAPFQVFMKYLEPDKNEGSVKSAAFYTASWSCGLATGPLVFGLFSPTFCFGLNAAVGIFLTIGIYAVARVKEKSPEFFESKKSIVKEEINAIDYTKYPDLAKVGWIACGLGTFTSTIVRAMEPFRAEYLKIGKLESAISKNKLPTPFKTPYPDEYKMFLPLTIGIFLYFAKSHTTQITTAIKLIKSVKPVLSVISYCEDWLILETTPAIPLRTKTAI